MTDNVDPRTLADRGWFGWGRWDAPYWFIGPEPGGKDDHLSSEAWMRLGGTELIDCRQHHLCSSNTRWHNALHPLVQHTWNNLIRLLLSYEGMPTAKSAEDLNTVATYQGDKWGSLTGDTALLYVSARNAPTLASDADRTTHQDRRMTTLRERLEENRPKFAVFYTISKGYPAIYERIVGACFGANGCVWHGSTLCALTRHPARKSIKEFVTKGREMRAAADY